MVCGAGWEWCVGQGGSAIGVGGWRSCIQVSGPLNYVIRLYLEEMQSDIVDSTESCLIIRLL